MTAITVPQHRTLAAIAARVVPHAFEDPARGARLVAAVIARIGFLPGRPRRALLLGVSLIGSRMAVCLSGEGVRRFDSLTGAAQDRMLARWIASRVPVARSAVQALRRLILHVEYGSPEAEREVGYRGSLHKRAPAVAWEDAPRAAAPLRVAPTIIDGDRLRADAVVIGSGAGGAVAAARLAEAGLDVLILEAGPLVAGEAFNEEQGQLFERLYADGGIRTTDDASLAFLQGSAVGGGTTVNWMAMLRTPTRVLEEWEKEHGTEGMSARDLAPIFERVERETHTHVVADADHSPNNRIILDGARTLGWRAYASSINAKDCVRAGFCGFGCRYGAKQGALQSYLPRALAAGARLLPDTRVSNLWIAERGGRFPLKRVAARHAARSITIEAPIVVLAAGAVGTPAILQRSGLGGGGVGRFLRTHPTTAVTGIYDREIYAAAGIPLSAVCDEFDGRDAGGYGTWIECPPTHPALAAAALSGFGPSHREVITRFPNLGTLIVLTRDGSDRGASHGEIRSARDPDHGASISYRLSARDSRLMAQGIEAATKLHFAAGATEVRTGHSIPVVMRSPGDVEMLRRHSTAPNDISLFTAHVNGTCRLGVDPRTAGCDPNGQRFGAPGVFVVDGSLLPTAPGVNPQETIFALASIVTERIAASWRGR